jgi:chorismate dehydratase
VGAVQYLNTKPLVHGLAGPGIALEYDLPSRLADQLAAGSLDVALIPSIEFFRGDAYRLVSDACIGCRGPVMSVKVFFRKRPDRINTLAVDEGSRTSATLARILLAHRCGVAPQRRARGPASASACAATSRPTCPIAYNGILIYNIIYIII